jgi:exopolyphosphatase / guanosine-5'-triphosphate,3'-diphosphate pyrophosphatase
MPVFAAIDVGSNALRLTIGDVDNQQRVTTLESLREPVRLGQDVFTNGVITEPTMDLAVAAFEKFRHAIDLRGASWTKAVATSAVREALNREIFVDRLAGASGIEVTAIGPEEEARLIFLAVSDKLSLKNKVALLIDIGGGSTEITLAEDESIVATESFRVGAVRLLNLFEEKKHGEVRFNQLLREYMDATQKKIKKEIGSRKIDLCVGTGGNIETLGDLRASFLRQGQNSAVTDDELDVLLKKLQGMTYEQRIQELGLRPDRADVIVPASAVLQKIVRIAGVKEVVIPHVGLKDGLLIDMIQELFGEKRPLRRDQVLASAIQLGRKYMFDEQHGTTVARYAARLFDETRALHNLGMEFRLLLEVAALLHDIGSFVNSIDHHKHTYYLLSVSPLIGLTQSQLAIVANVARYHRKSMPKPQHDGYRALSSKERVVVAKLSALLRLADAMDNEHASKVESFSVEYKKPKLTLRLRGEGDLLLEKWALVKKAPMFEDVFSVKLSIED